MSCKERIVKLKENEQFPQKAFFDSGQNGNEKAESLGESISSRYSHVKLEKAIPSISLELASAICTHSLFRLNGKTSGRKMFLGTDHHKKS